MKKAIIFTLISCNLGFLYGQNQEDIFRYSYQQFVGSTRSLGMAGAWGAVGADLSSASLNPAGLGLYRRREIMGAMAITTTRNQSTYQGNTVSDGRTGFNIPNFGAVLNFSDNYMGKPQTKGIVGGSLAFGLNRLNDFQNNNQYGGKINNTTIGDYFAKQAQGTDSVNFTYSDYDNVLMAQAWRNGFINNKGGSKTAYDSWQNLIGDSVYTMQQNKAYQTRGNMQEWYAAGGMNVGNFLYLGASLVLQSVRYKSESNYQEKLVQSSISGNALQKAEVYEAFESRGTGVGGKFGVIFRPLDFLRVGAAYHTPVRLNMTDDFINSMNTTYSFGLYSQSGVEERSEYQVITPDRIIFSGALTLGKWMLISADYERIDYTKGRLESKNMGFDFSTANANNKAIYAVGQNIKAGIEICGKNTRYRLGYGIVGSPYNTTIVSKEDGMKQVVSAGFGWIYDNAYFFDLAVSDRFGKEYLTPYEGNPANAETTTHKLNFQVGAGYRF